MASAVPWLAVACGHGSSAISACSTPAEGEAMSVEWGVRVNEVGIFSNRLGADWWVTALTPWVLNGRALCLGLCPAGGVWYLPGGAKDDAEFMRDHIISHGVHRNEVKVTTRTRAEAELKSRQEAMRADALGQDPG